MKQRQHSHVFRKAPLQRIILSALFSVLLFWALPVNIEAAAPSSVIRNTVFTSPADMAEKTGSTDPELWSSLYLTAIERTFWNFAGPNERSSHVLTLETAVNCYRNLEELLDNGFLLDYRTLENYTADYLAKKGGVPDAFYSILHGALGNPYLIDRPPAVVTATTYNGRDYSSVFNAEYYYNTNPDLWDLIGYNPPELLRHFVEIGINEGRKGNASFDFDAFKAEIDAEIRKEQQTSPAYAAKSLLSPEPLGIYSYSRACYYGKYLGHYGAEETDTVPEGTGSTYNETSTRSIYTGLPTTTALANQRPIAVMMPTDTAAQPSYGIGRADVLYEMMEEGGISRQMAIINDWKGMDRIGNIRSCRLYYLSTAMEWDPVLIHFGGVAYMRGTIDRDDIQNLSGTYAYGTGGKAPGAFAFYRTKDRKAPHNAYISSDGIIKAMKREGYPQTLRADWYNPQHFLFADTENTLLSYDDSVSAAYIDLTDVFPYTKSTLTYNPEDGLYYKTLHNKKQIDGIDKKQLTFSNVIVQYVDWRQLDEKGYLGMDMLGVNRDGYYFTRGRVIPIHWTKTKDHEVTRYFDARGNEIRLNRGKTYIAIAQNGKRVVFH